MTVLSKPRVLFLDDDPAFLKIVSERVAAGGYDILAETDSAKAIEAIRGGRADAAFIDFKMPSLNGIEVITAIREFDRNIPLVLLTGHADQAIMEKYKNLNIHGFFAKVDDLKKLGQILEVVLRGIERKKG